MEKFPRVDDSWQKEYFGENIRFSRREVSHDRGFDTVWMKDISTGEIRRTDEDMSTGLRRVIQHIPLYNSDVLSQTISMNLHEGVSAFEIKRFGSGLRSVGHTVSIPSNNIQLASGYDESGSLNEVVVSHFSGEMTEMDSELDGDTTLEELWSVYKTHGSFSLSPLAFREYLSLDSVDHEHIQKLFDLDKQWMDHEISELFSNESPDVVADVHNISVVALIQSLDRIGVEIDSDQDNDFVSYMSRKVVSMIDSNTIIKNGEVDLNELLNAFDDALFESLMAYNLSLDLAGEYTTVFSLGDNNFIHASVLDYEGTSIFKLKTPYDDSHITFDRYKYKIDVTGEKVSVIVVDSLTDTEHASFRFEKNVDVDSLENLMASECDWKKLKEIVEDDYLVK